MILLTKISLKNRYLPTLATLVFDLIKNISWESKSEEVKRDVDTCQRIFMWRWVFADNINVNDKHLKKVIIFVVVSIH